MAYVTINGNRYDIPEVTFDTICQLEENGVYLLNMDKKNPKLATMIRGLVAWIMGVEPEEASKEIQEHIQNGGDIGEILRRVTEAVASSGFFGKQKEAVREFPQNREQRRNNTRHTQKS